MEDAGRVRGLEERISALEGERQTLLARAAKAEAEVRHLTEYEGGRYKCGCVAVRADRIHGFCPKHCRIIEGWRLPALETAIPHDPKEENDATPSQPPAP